MDVEVVGDKATVQAYIDWFLEDITIIAYCTFSITDKVKTKTVNGIQESTTVRQIKFDTISRACIETLGEPIVMSIKKRVENGLNTCV